MAKPKTVLWEADEHTLAKHQILRAYLEAWIPIMSRWNDRLLYLHVADTPTGLEQPPTVAIPRALADRPEPGAVFLRGRLRQAHVYPRVTLDLGLDAIYLTRGAAPEIEAAVKAGTPIYAEVAVAANGQARVSALVIDGRRYE